MWDVLSILNTRLLKTKCDIHQTHSCVTLSFKVLSETYDDPTSDGQRSC